MTLLPEIIMKPEINMKCNSTKPKHTFISYFAIFRQITFSIILQLRDFCKEGTLLHKYLTEFQGDTKHEFNP